MLPLNAVTVPDALTAVMIMPGLLKSYFQSRHVSRRIRDNSILVFTDFLLSVFIDIDFLLMANYRC